MIKEEGRAKGNGEDRSGGAGREGEGARGEGRGKEGRGKECVPPPLQSYFDHCCLAVLMKPHATTLHLTISKSIRSSEQSYQLIPAKMILRRKPTPVDPSSSLATRCPWCLSNTKNWLKITNELQNSGIWQQAHDVDLAVWIKRYLIWFEYNFHDDVNCVVNLKIKNKKVAITW